MNDLGPRIIGALGYVSVLLFAAFSGGWIQWGIYFALSAVMVYELISMSGRFTVYGYIAVIVVALFPWYYNYIDGQTLVSIAAGAGIFLLLFFWLFPIDQEKKVRWGLYSLPLFYVGASIVVLLGGTHNFSDYEYEFLLILFAIMWINDTGAYFTGRALGKNKMSPEISPKKTWEGFVGGIVLSMVLIPFIAVLLGEELSFYWAIIAGVIAALGTVGDLLESKLKRHYGIKDSGNIIPGHGGILDRMDSLLFTIPFYFLCLHGSHLV